MKTKNLHERVLAEKRLSTDGIVNLHDVAYDIPDFVWLIQTFPDIVVIAGREDMLKQINSLLKVKGRSNVQLLAYDTAFNIGEFYVSVLLFRGTCFKENPVIPAMFMLHERKLRTTHQKFVKILSEKSTCAK